MSEEIGAGVKILLERGKSNPDEVMGDYVMWGSLVEAVFSYVETGQRTSKLRGLTDHEINLLFEMFNSLYRTTFDSWVMKKVLGVGDEGEERMDTYALSQGKRRLQGTIQPGEVYQTLAAKVDASLFSRLKQELGIK